MSGNYDNYNYVKYSNNNHNNNDDNGNNNNNSNCYIQKILSGNLNEVEIYMKLKFVDK